MERKLQGRKTSKGEERNKRDRWNPRKKGITGVKERRREQERRGGKRGGGGREGNEK